MIGLVFKLCKLAVFALAVLVLGQWIKWDGKTLSDHVRKHVTTAQAPTSEIHETLPLTVTPIDRVRETRAHPMGSEKAKQHITPADREELKKLLDD